MRLEIKKGNRFGNFEVIEELPVKRLPSGQTNRVFRCECVCGKSKDIRLGHLVRYKINSCGCLNIRRKGKTDSEKYIRKIWRAIKYRTDKNYHEKHLYFDKGIAVCDLWASNYDSFEKWAIKNKLRKGFHIDRKDGSLGYGPDNCRVVTPTVNANNRVNTHVVKYNNTTYPFMDLIRLKGLVAHQTSIRNRIKRGWSIEDAFNKKIRVGQWN